MSRGFVFSLAALLLFLAATFDVDVPILMDPRYLIGWCLLSVASVIGAIEGLRRK